MSVCILKRRYQRGVPKSTCTETGSGWGQPLTSHDPQIEDQASHLVPDQDQIHLLPRETHIDGFVILNLEEPPDEEMFHGPADEHSTRAAICLLRSILQINKI